MPNGKGIRLSISTDEAHVPGYIGIITEVAQAFAEFRGFDSDTAGEFSIAIDEIAMNAIKHGNKFDPAKTAIICFYHSDDRVGAYAEDQSTEKFDPTPHFRKEVSADATRDELLSSSGRGFILIANYTDFQRYKWLNPGNRVYVEKLKPRLRGLSLSDERQLCQ